MNQPGAIRRIRLPPSPSAVTPIAVAIVLLLLGAGTARPATRAWSGGGSDELASTPANWVGNVAPLPGDDIVLEATSAKNMTWDAAAPSSVGSWTQVGYSGTVTFATVYGASGFVNVDIAGDCIVSNGTWTHKANATEETYRLSISIGGKFTLSPDASVNANGKGYGIARSGPGAPPAGSQGAASHGGTGWQDVTHAAGSTYGSITAPVTIGSCGAETSGRGGGAVRFSVSGSSVISGTISASGAAAGGHGAGSGGSIYLTTGAISGEGAIEACGGTSSWGRGGGGRVAVILTSGNDFGSVDMTAYGASGGAAGTVYKQTALQGPGEGELTIDNNMISTGIGVTTAIPGTDNDESIWTIRQLTLKNKGVLEVGSGRTLDLRDPHPSSNAGDNTDGIRLNGGTLLIDNNLTIDNWSLIVDGAHTVTGDVTVASGGNITHSGNSTTETYRIDLTIIGDLTVDGGGEINVYGKGYGIARNGPGAPPTGSQGAASHGGMGWLNATHPAGLTYGSITAPVTIGSCGAETSGRGGGAVRLTVGGACAFFGTISASGAAAGGHGAGAGGSIYITADTISGDGTIAAHGGTSLWGRGGGGGRVAVILASGIDFGSLSMSAYGASGGAAGTVYKQTASHGPGEGELTIDYNMASTGDMVNTLVSSNVTDTTVGDVIIRNGAKLQIASGQVLTVQGNWSNKATFLPDSGSGVRFAGVNAATVHDNNTWQNLTIATHGKRVYFQAGATQTVNGVPTFENVVWLLSTMPGTQWNLVKPGVAGEEQPVGAVVVQDSDARGGKTFVAGLGSASMGNNLNWTFPPRGSIMRVR